MLFGEHSALRCRFSHEKCVASCAKKEDLARGEACLLRAWVFRTRFIISFNIYMEKKNMSLQSLTSNPVGFFQEIDFKNQSGTPGVVIYTNSLWNRACSCCTSHIQLPVGPNKTVLINKRSLEDFFIRNLDITEDFDLDESTDSAILHMIRQVKIKADSHWNPAKQVAASQAPKDVAKFESLESRAQDISFPQKQLPSKNLVQLQLNNVHLCEAIFSSGDKEDAKKAARLLLAKIAGSQIRLYDRQYRATTQAIKETIEFQSKGRAEDRLGGRPDAEASRNLLDRLITAGSPVK